MNSSVLGRVIERCAQVRAGGGRPVVFFDLDATLFDNTSRTLQILREFAESFCQVELQSRLERDPTLPAGVLPYLLEDVLDFLDVQDASMKQFAFEFWMKRFFSDSYQIYDEPIRGAPAYVRDVHALATVVYLSGRNAPQMAVGCTQALRENGFPIAQSGTVLLLKPHIDMNDLHFKQGTLPFVQSLGIMVACFDNEPDNCNLFQAYWPDAIVVHLDTHRHPNSDPLQGGIESIPHFNRLTF